MMIKGIQYMSDFEAKKAIIEVGKRMYAKGFVAANDGNISCKVGPDTIWTTCTGVSKGYMTQDMLVKINLDGKVLLGNKKPSSEVKMHIRVYRENPNVMAVTHAHPLVATSFAIAGISLDKAVLPEAVVQLGTVPIAKYATPGTQEVPDSIAPFCKDYNGVLLANHGALSWGADLFQAFHRLESIEYYAQILMYTGNILGKQNELSCGQVNELINIRQKLGLGGGGIPTCVSSSTNLEDVSTGKGDYGVFERVEDAIDAAYEAQKRYLSVCTMKDRDRIIEAIRQAAREHAKDFAKRIVEESKMGRYEDKIQKNLEVANGTPGTEILTTDAISGDAGLMLEEYAPFGLIGAVTPVTNPTETIVNNTISMIAGGNAVIFNVHPGAKHVCAYCLQILNRTIMENGGPANLITMAKEPAMECVEKISSSPKVRLMVGTGGMPMVNALLRSGKKTIGAGAGNPPVIVDDTADITLAAKEIYRGASFDNNLLCLAEKEVFVMNTVADEFIRKMTAEGAYLLSQREMEKLLDIVFVKKEQEYDVNKKWVGKDAGLMLEQLGIHKPAIRLLICETPKDHPFVMVEQLMPILPVVRCATFEECVEGAYAAESGNRHTSSMFSQNVDNMTTFARKMETTIFVKNGATLKGVGIGGNGYVSMTIAGPTGEGLTCARSFTRRRRCMLADGGFRVI